MTSHVGSTEPLLDRVRLIFQTRAGLVLIVAAALAATGIAVFEALRAPTPAELTFVHATDPHIFEESGKTSDSIRAAHERQNRKSLLSALRLARGVSFGQHEPFLVITGDFGLDSAWTNPGGGHSRTAQIDTLVHLLTEEPVAQIYVVSGNNDVASETADPRGIEYHARFFADVQKKLDELGTPVRIRDLTACYSASARSDDECIADLAGTSIRLIGFPSHSFKNDGVGAIDANGPHQETIVSRADGIVRRAESLGKRVLILTHIPDLADPFQVAQSKSLKRTPDDTTVANHSAWNVRASILRRWRSVIGREGVTAVLAGHFHDIQRVTYQEPYSWSPRSAVLGEPTKTLVAPPLAIKRQDAAPITSRGVSLTRLRGLQASRQLLWLNPLTGDFEADRVTAGTLRVPGVQAPRSTRALSLAFWWIVVLSPALPFAALSLSYRRIVEQKIREVKRRLGQYGEDLYERAYGNTLLRDIDRELREFYDWRTYVAPIVLTCLVASGFAVLGLTHLGIDLGFSGRVRDVLGRTLPTVIVAGGGAYLWGLDDLIKRHRSADLSSSALHTTWLRMMICAAIGGVLNKLFNTDTSLDIVVALAIGGLPIEDIKEWFTSRVDLRTQRATMRAADLQHVQGLTRRMRDRLHDEDIDSVQTLAFADPIRLLFRTNIEWNVILDLVDQAMLVNVVGDKIEKLRPLSVRGAIEMASLYEQVRGSEDEPGTPKLQPAQADSAAGLEENAPEASAVLAFEDEPDSLADRTNAQALLKRIGEALEIGDEAARNIGYQMYYDPLVGFVWTHWNAARPAGFARIADSP